MNRSDLHPNACRILSTRPLVRDDLTRLRTHAARPRLKSLRDSHHAIARLLASGMKTAEVCLVTGISYSRLSVLRADPSMKELIERYRGMVTKEWVAAQDQFHNYIYSNGLKSQRMISDRLDQADEENESIPLKELIAIAADSADRVGYAKRTVQTNLNFDFAAKLEQAIERSKMKTIEAA